MADTPHRIGYGYSHTGLRQEQLGEEVLGAYQVPDGHWHSEAIPVDL
jgi:hypothetical protein